MRKRTVFSLLVALMALVALTGNCTPLAAPAQASIHLHDMVQAPSRQVRLSDIATVHGGSSQVLGLVLVATLSRPGQPVRIDAARIVQMIERQQPALAGRFAMTGAASVSVVLASEPPSGVVRNQRVMAQSRIGAILVEKPMVARSEGRPGQSVRVIDLQSAFIHQATVVAQQRVELK
ncbi:flagella basal body P-ring formation protein FlgA [Lacisediminimonas sp.]|uniref:flagella basal body P-ring formation protein FlgA n=1 Tax=Lacisediminimonas sp. TaxID=3060582 RepID=UPI002723FAE1|nr:flagella basal body P-ring formation protein FlgA [Lacisediminimonas sp.]MDO8299539.1 flagella basal body P-ring formation protein FlgA [Lacisediminimonas sp.]